MADWLKLLKDYIDTLESALGNPTGDMSAVTQGEDASLAAYAIYAREMSRGHNQTRLCLIVPDLANLASDAPNTAIKTELEKIGTVAVLDETGVDGGQEDWDFYDAIVVGSNTYAAFTNANLDDLILLKVPVMVCNRDVAMHLLLGDTQTQSASDVNEYCETIHNRVMYLVFGSLGEKVIFSEAAVSDRLDMSDAQLTEQVLMVSVTADGNTKAVVGWLPQDKGGGTINQLSDGSDMPACRLFAGCFINADKLTDLGTELLRSMTRNFAQAGISATLTLKAAAAQVAAILNDTNMLQTDWVNGGRLDNLLDAITAAGPTNTQMETARDAIIAAIPAMVGTDGAALVSDGWDAALATILDNFSQARIEYLDELDFDLAAAIGAITAAGPTNAQLNTAIALCAQVADGWDAALATILDNFNATRIGDLDELAAANLPADIDELITSKGKQLFTMDFWSTLQEEVEVTAAGATETLPSITVEEVPGTIVRAVLMFKFRMIENTYAGVNKLNGPTVAGTSQVIQIQDDGESGWFDAINFPDDFFTLADSAREGGDVTVGSIDIATRVDENDIYDVTWLVAKADSDFILFNDVQVGLRVWYSV